MNKYLVATVLMLLSVVACQTNTALPTSVPPPAATAFAQLPTSAGNAGATAQAGFSDAATRAAVAAGTMAPGASTAIAGAAGTGVPAAQTAAAQAIGTAVPAAGTAAAGAQTALATLTIQVPAIGTQAASAIGTAAAAAGAIVQVTLVEFKIDMPATVRAGPVVLRVTNNGTIIHGLRIQGNNVDQGLEKNISPGETQNLPLVLQPGTYKVFCPVDGHRDQGMQVNLTVTP